MFNDDADLRALPAVAPGRERAHSRVVLAPAAQIPLQPPAVHPGHDEDDLPTVAVRPETVPVYGEMRSIHPVALTPVPRATAYDAIPQPFVAPPPLGAGPSRTHPGLIISVARPGVRALESLLEAAHEHASPPPTNTRYRQATHHAARP
ncbi:hypothetical protein CF645_38500, partial [Burkholderia pseudomallei]